MSMDAWLAEYERLDAEMANGDIHQMNEAELCNAAHEAMVDLMADAVDAAKDRRKYGE